MFRRGVPPNASYIFKHALVQDAAYSTILRARKRELHATLGHVLEERFPELVTSQPEVIAHHFSEAGLAELAVKYWRKAAERSLERSAHVEATAHLERAIRDLNTLPEGSERNRDELPLQMALGSTMRALKGHAADETLEVYNRARALLDDTTPAKERMAVLYGAWAVTVVRSDCKQGLEIAKQSLPLALGDDPEAAAFASRMLGLALWLTGSFEEAVPHLERAVRLYAPGSGNLTDLRYSQDHAVWALSVLALNQWMLGYPERASESAVRSLEWSRAINHAMTIGFSLSFGSALWGFFPDGRQNGGASAEEALAYIIENDLRSYIAWGQFYRGLALVRQGDHAEGIALMRKGIIGTDEINQRIMRTARLAHFAWALTSAGNFDEAAAVLSEALLAVEESGERFCESELHRLYGDLHKRMGAAEQAEAEFCKAIEIAQAQKAKAWELRAATSLAQHYSENGQRSRAIEVLSPIYAGVLTGADTFDLQAAKTVLDGLA